MKQLILFIMLAVMCSCSSGYHYEEQIQTGIVIDVEYHPARTVMISQPHTIGKMHGVRMVPYRRSEYWDSHVHYEDTICVYENIYTVVSQGDTVYRKVRVKVYDKLDQE